ncbi:uncharacterized protein LOC128735696 [Sabethes cyaneus]|uniref:uncharacterized protein LOC128735696 n=1 Tax=Sabethes cyaneus TaxID=53552 RepID=UPI00237EC694|nr:uncharacterized protein LOC128735696 [Sabethes cyaneus]
MKHTKKTKKLLVRRNNIIGSAKLIKEFDANYIYDRDFPQLKFRIEKLDSLWEQFNDVQSEIECETELSSDLADERADFENQYFELKGSLAGKLAIAKEQIETPANIPGSPPAHVPSVRLPELKIPDFSGNFDEWMNFHDLFSTTIHINSQLSAVQNFQYLKTVLKGDALRLVQSLAVSAANYVIAWDLLKKRFDNRNLLIKQHFSALLATPSVHKESSSALFSLADEFDKHICVLNKLEESQDHWNSFLVELLSSKLDPVTQKEWENQLEDDRRPTYENLVAYIQKRSRILQSISLSQNSPSVAKPESKHESKLARSKTFSYHSATASDNLPNCCLCKQSHTLSQCDEFKKLTPQKRFEVAKRQGLCLNCLKSSHLMKNCFAGPCRTCNRRRHTLLHLNSQTASNSHKTVAAQVGHCQHAVQPATINESPSSVACIADQCHVVPRVTGLAPSSSDGPEIRSNSYRPPSVSSAIPSSSSQATNCQTLPSSQSLVSKACMSSVFMLTAYVKVMHADGSYILARALLDCASEANFVTESLAQRLCSKRISTNIEVYGISQSVKKVNHQTTITVSSRFGSYTTSMDFLILPSLTRILPTANVDISRWVIPRHLPLADPKFNIAHDVELIIGIKNFFSILQNEQFTLGSGLPVLRKTVFGYVVAGEAINQPTSTVVCNVSSIDNLESIVRKFWEVESFERGKALSLEELYCENHFRETHRRASDGRYVVRLPVREEMLESLGESVNIAERRFRAIEKKLSSDPSLHVEYSKFMDEYLSLGHMDEFEPDLLKPHFYLPHHAIQRPDSTTTKTRVVFDASCRGNNNISLNDLCYIGPTVQPPLVSTLVNFRLPRYAVTADAEKMYRQVWVDSSDCLLQLILFRKSPDEELKTYCLKTVTYGTAPAPYLATRVVNQLAEDEAANFPLAASMVKRCFYVDDYLSGDDDEHRLVETNRQLIDLLRSGGFNMRKWCSNSATVLSNIPEPLRDSRTELEISQSGSVKALGLLWHPLSDEFSFNVPEFSSSEPITKRLVLSEMSRLFDPMGLVGATIVSAKIFLQALWSDKLNWNDVLSVEYQKWWIMYRAEIETLSMLRISRRLLVDNYRTLELHVFTDASDSAYGCCIYVRSISATGEQSCNLVMSKSRVSPLRKLSTPRLELCAAVLGAQLADFVLESTKWTCPITYWTDSSIVLHWIASSSSSWKVFVSNRIAEIHRLTGGSMWRHVPSELNPADKISRGIMPSQLKTDDLWWHGPPYLQQDTSAWPENFIELSPLHKQARTEEGRTVVSLVVSTTSTVTEFIEQHSTLFRLQRKVAWMLRFAQNCRTKEPQNRQFGPLVYAEMERALKCLIKQTQLAYFSSEIEFLVQDNRPTRKEFKFKSQLKSLNPFVDAEGLLRIAGRLHNLDVPYDTKHPIVVPQKAHLTVLIFKQTHVRMLHAGPQLLLATLRQRFWPIRGRDLAKKIVRQCITCFRCNPRSICQVMGPLPASRVTASRAFINCGVDYCGPFFVKTPNRRGPPVKVFVAIFVCMASKAVHIDMVYSLTSDAFVNMLKRLVGRRGRVTDIYCDNARTFVGANRLLEENRLNFNAIHQSSKLLTYCADNGITFHFNPARSPHFGGLWEASVKTFKYHLYRVIKDTQLNIDDFNTLLVQVEGIMNSRPLTPLSSDPADVVALTPGHFLVGEPLQSLPEPNLCDIPINRLDSFQKMQQRLQHFWRAWSRDYVAQLQDRKKWPVVQPNIDVGTLVLLKQDNTPPMRWNLGRIEQTFPGKDGRVRVVQVRTAHGTYRRAITEICPLPIDHHTEQDDHADPPALPVRSTTH